MKKLLKYKLIAFLLLAVVWSGCDENIVTPELKAFEIEDDDLVQVDDATPNVPVSFSAKGAEGKNVFVKITPEGSTSAVYSNTLKAITSDNINRVKIAVPFPTPDIAPSGKYDIAVSIEGAPETSMITYNVNVLNNRSIKYCDFPAPVANKVNIFVSIPGGADVTAANKNIYITGNFETDNGGSDWSGGGNEKFKLTKLSDRCYFIALDKFDAKKLYKFTLGSWDSEFLDAKGNVPSNLEAPGGNVNVIVYNFKTLPIKQYAVPQVLPAAAIKSGHVTVVVDVNTNSDDSKYYLVKEGASSLDGAVQMTRVAGSNKVAGAVPKESDAKYVVVKDEIQKVGINNFDVPRAITIDGVTQPVESSVPGFRGELQVTPVPAELFIVGGATPGGWNNPVPTPSQQFTKSGNVFTLTLTLKANDGYLLLPVNGSWDKKFGMGGTPITGDVIPQGGDFKSPDEEASYKITVDFGKGTYLLEKQ